MKLCPFSLCIGESPSYPLARIVFRDLIRTFPMESQFFHWSAIKQSILVRFLYST